MLQNTLVEAFTFQTMCIQFIA